MIRFLSMVAVFSIVGLSPTSSQIKPPDESIIPEEYEPEEFPMWAQDLRRFEIITFGSFPLTYVFSSLIYDLTLSAIHNGDAQYGLGTQRGEGDLAIIIGAAGITSALIAIADLIITLSKRETSRNDATRQLQRPNP